VWEGLGKWVFSCFGCVLGFSVVLGVGCFAVCEGYSVVGDVVAGGFAGPFWFLVRGIKIFIKKKIAW
jgi:hypothetical protein